MRTILFDIISTQDFINGGGEFTFRILEELLLISELHIIGLYDSKRSFPKEGIDFYQNNLNEIIDINEYKDINNIIEQKQVDSFFIGIAQRYSKYTIENITCRTIITIHDIGDIESYDNKISMLWKKEKRFHFRLFLDKKYRKTPFRYYYKLIDFCKKTNVEIVTVSEYTQSSISYYFPELTKKNIEVLYPPMRNLETNENIENHQLKQIIEAGSPYFLLLNAHRRDKNALLAIEVFQRYLIDDKRFYLVTTGDIEKTSSYHINLPLLSSSDLGNAYKNAYALIFPSLQEGFGYPPLEAMSYGTPVLCANVCSMPMILSTAALYFSPFYKNDLYMKIKELEKNYSYYKEQSAIRYLEIKQRQNADFIKLIHKITL